MVTTLVTSAIESTWPKKGKVIFLGKWCCLFDRKDLWSNLDYKIEDFHWDDRKKLQNDYVLLEEIYENFLDSFHIYLNNLHKKKFSKRFWRILIGPWLYSSICIVYDRWFMLLKLASKKNALKKYSLKDIHESLNTFDMEEFNIKIEKDEWNEALYCLLIEKFFSSNIDLINLKESYKKPQLQNESKVIEFIKKISNFISKIFSKHSDVFIISPYLSHFNRFYLQLHLSQFPAFWFKIKKKIVSYNRSFIRNESLSFSTAETTEFEKVLDEILLILIPKSYLEGFEDLLKESENQGWPINPESIFTSNSHTADDIFKCWCGLRTEKGTKLIIGQHGGNFGMTPMAFHESHQIKISDKWLSWGWHDPDNEKIQPLGNFTSSFKRLKHNTNGNALLVGMTLPRYSYYLYSVPIAGQVEDYLNDQIKFAKALPNKILSNLKIRTYQSDRGWQQKDRWKENFTNEIPFDDNRFDLLKSLKNSRIFVGTYNATTYLETFSANMPSIIFWNPNHWEINKTTKNLLETLEKKKIFHSCPIKAAKHLENIWEDVDSWWFSEDVQSAKNEFIQVFSKQNSSTIKSIKEYLV